MLARESRARHIAGYDRKTCESGVFVRAYMWAAG